MSAGSFLALAVGLLLVACAGPSWQQLRSEDSITGYRRFLAEHPRSPFAAEARERIAVLLLERDPSVDGLERFRRDHPDSAAIGYLTQRTEIRAFEMARSQATAEAFDRFLTAFPDGSQARRAAGNAVYLRAGGFVGRPAALTAFVHEHPESDYAAEARRSLGLVDAESKEAFRAITLRIEVAPGVPDADRLTSMFAERARAIYAETGVSLTDADAPASLVIRHHERRVGAGEAGDTLAKPGVLAETEVSLVRAESPASPEFQDLMTWRTPASDVRPGGSALFASSAAGFWEHFHVPIARWATSRARRGGWSEGSPTLGVGGDAGRAIVLDAAGGFRVLDLSDPAAPRMIGRYARSGAAMQFSGVRAVAGRVALFGEDGAEIVAQQSSGFAPAATYDRGAVGGVRAVEEDGRGFVLLAGTRGLIRIPLDGGSIERLVEHPLRGIARSGEVLYAVDDRWLYSGPVGDPQPTRFFTALELPNGVEPLGVAVGDGIGLVYGPGGVATFAARGAGPARLLARSRASDIGSVTDAAVLGGAVFVLGERGLLVLDPGSGRVVDSVDVDTRLALGRSGGHFVAMGRDRVEIVDAAPWIARGGAAAMAP